MATLTFKLLFTTHCSACSTSRCLLSTLEDGIRRQNSPFRFHWQLHLTSEAQSTQDDGPIAEPYWLWSAELHIGYSENVHWHPRPANCIHCREGQTAPVSPWVMNAALCQRPYWRRDTRRQRTCLLLACWWWCSAAVSINAAVVGPVSWRFAHCTFSPMDVSFTQTLDDLPLGRFALTKMGLNPGRFAHEQSPISSTSGCSLLFLF